MIDDGGELWEDLSGLADAFADFGRRLLHASRQLHAPGVLPPASLLSESDTLRHDFGSVRERIVARARALGVAVPAPGGLESVKALALLLDAVSDAEDRHESEARDPRVGPALEVLDRVARLEHSESANFPPLLACQEQARALRRSILDGSPETADGDLDGLSETDHPFAYLVTMAEGPRCFDEDLWESLASAVAAAFGSPLAEAVRLGKVVERDPDRVTGGLEADASPVVESGPAAVPSVTIAWASGPPVFGAGNGPLEPAVSAPPSFLPRGLASLLSPRRFGRAAGRRSAPGVERLETVRLLSGPTAGGFATGAVPVTGAIPGDGSRPPPTAGAFVGAPTPAGPGPAVSQAGPWALRFPRLAAGTATGPPRASADDPGPNT